MMRRVGFDLLLVPPRVEASLWRRLRFENEKRCREQIFTRYRLLARAIARRQHGRRPKHGAELGDMEHFAYEGLLQAIDRYDPLRGIPFGAYARRRIVGSIADGAARMSESDATWSQRRRAETDRARSLRHDEEEDPVAALAALVSGLAIGLMLEGSALVVGADGIDPRPNAYQSLEWRELHAVLAGGIAALPEREAVIIRQHYEAGVSFAQIAHLLNLSKGRVSQLHAAALGRLRRRLHGYRR
jgi:RNA polymerase sigma factor for flagellar operon FliA